MKVNILKTYIPEELPKFKPYKLTIIVDSLRVEGALRTVTARDELIPAYLEDYKAHHFNGATHEDIHDILTALDNAITWSK